MERRCAIDTETFGQRLRRRRQQVGLSLQEVATAVGRSPSWLSQVERGLRWGGRPPAYRDLIRLAGVLGVTIEVLVADPDGGGATRAEGVGNVAAHIRPVENGPDEYMPNGIVLTHNEHDLLRHLKHALAKIGRWLVPVTSLDLLLLHRTGKHQTQELLEVPIELLDGHRRSTAIKVTDNTFSPWALPGDYLLIDQTHKACAAVEAGALIVVPSPDGVTIARATHHTALEQEPIAVYINTYAFGRLKVPVRVSVRA